MTNHHIATQSFDLIDRITNCDCADTAPRCLHFDASIALRELLIDRDATSNADEHDPAPFHYDYIRALLFIIDATPYMTDRMTQLLLDNSLCPMHAIDYAICFDDDDDECAAIRTIHPSHDT